MRAAVYHEQRIDDIAQQLGTSLQPVIPGVGPVLFLLKLYADSGNQGPKFRQALRRDQT